MGVILIYLMFYHTRLGDYPVVEYIKGIDDVDEKAEIDDTLQMIREHGAKYLISGSEDTKRIEQGLYEIRRLGIASTTSTARGTWYICSMPARNRRTRPKKETRSSPVRGDERLNDPRRKRSERDGQS